MCTTGIESIYLPFQIYYYDLINSSVRCRVYRINREFVARITGPDNKCGDGLKRLPKSYDPEHQYIEDLKRKSFFVMRYREPEILFNPHFIDGVEKTFKAAKPLMDYISYALDVPF